MKKEKQNSKIFIKLTENPRQKVGNGRIPENTDKPKDVKSTKKK